MSSRSQTPVHSLGSDLQSPSLSSQPPPAQQVSRQTPQAGECWSAPILCAGISPLCPLHPCGCTLLRGSEASPPPPSPPVKGLLVCGNFSSFTAPSPRCGCHPYSIVSVFSFSLPRYVGIFLPFWKSGLMPAFSRCSLGVVPHVDVFFMYLWGGR